MECNVERELRERLGIFRRVWVAYTRLDSVQVTLFPSEPHSQYQIVTRTRVGPSLWNRIERIGENGEKVVDRVLNVDLIERYVREDLGL